MQTSQILKAVDCCKKLYWAHRYIHISYAVREEVKRPKRKVTETTVLIRLLDNNERVLGIKSKQDSEKLAKKQNMLLEKMEVHKFGTTYPVYKLISSADILRQDELQKSASAGRTIKKLSLSGRITDHDLGTKIKIIKKLLAKHCEVHIAVTGSPDTSSSMEAVYKKIQEQLQGESRILDKRLKESALKFIIIPPKNNQEQKS